MPRLDDLRIQTVVSENGTNSSNLDSRQGYLKARHNIFDGTYEIQDYVVDQRYRGQGYGKELLTAALYNAKTLGASAITASYIASLESVYAISSVFGAESITFKNDRFNGRDTLHYDIMPDDCVDDSYRDVIDQSVKTLPPQYEAFNEDILLLEEKLGNFRNIWGSKFYMYADEQLDTYQAVLALQHALLEERYGAWIRHIEG